MKSHPQFLYAMIAAGSGWVVLLYAYYRRQNTGRRLGGPISVPKTVWLGLTTFLYFVFPGLLWWFSRTGSLADQALLAGSLMLFRAAFQSVWMFFVKKWSPPMGIGFNLAYALIILLYSINGDALRQLLAYLWAGLMLTDTIFAWQFYRLVGALTKGDAAIWYADNSERFRRINRQTILADLFFLLFFVYICSKLI